MHDFTPSLKPDVCLHCWLTQDHPNALHIDRTGTGLCASCNTWTVIDGICINGGHGTSGRWLAWKDQLDKDPMVTRWRPDGRRVGSRRWASNPEAAAKTLAERAARQRGC